MNSPTSSLGSIAVASSDPNVIYVGSGEATAWQRVGRQRHYKSTDAGKTWTHGLEAGRPDRHDGRASTNPDIAFAAGARSCVWPQSPNAAVYRRRRSKTWQKVLFKDAETGIGFRSHPNPRIIFADLANAATSWE